MKKNKLKEIIINFNEIKEENYEFLGYYIKQNSDLYVGTSISEGNDWILGKLTKGKERVVSEISSFPIFEELMCYHLGFLNKNRIDILFLNYTKELWTEKNLKNVDTFWDPFYIKIGLKGITKIEEIEEFKKLAKRNPDYVAIQINPLEFDSDLVEYCHTNDIGVVGYNIFGNPVDREFMIRSFSKKFLIQFAAFWCDIVYYDVTSDPEEALVDISDLRGQVDKYNKNTDLIEMTKSVHKTKEAPGNIVKIYVNGLLSGNNLRSKALEDDLYTFSILSDMPEESVFDLTNSDDYYLRIISDIKEICDTGLSEVLDSEKCSYLRYMIWSRIKAEFSERSWNYIVKDLGDFTWSIQLKAKFPFIWMRKRYTLMISKTGHVLFK